MKKFCIFTAAIGVILSSCSQEDLIVQDKSGTNLSVKLTKEEALSYASSIISEIDPEPTRSVRTFADIELIGQIKTRSGETILPDSTLYLVNFKDNSGFALISADRRMERPFYALSDNGNLILSDTTQNKGLAMTLSNIYAVATEDVIKTSLSTTRGPITGLYPGGAIGSGYELIETISPLLNKNVRLWDQTSPYNQYCFTNDKKSAYVGCTAVATAMIMSYYEWPITYLGYSFNWSAIKQYPSANDQLYHLLRELGRPENLDMNYGELYVSEGSGANIEKNAQRTFTNFGYSNCGKFETYSLLTAYNKVKQGKPIIIVGTTKKPNSSEEVGHAWNIDGCLVYEAENLAFPSEPNRRDYYLHLVWGWRGNSNGYFMTLGGERYQKDIDDTDYDSISKDLLFDKNLKILYNFNPIKK
ncbi:MAG: C10 family peptidase [Prevotella sp.]|nr:C10 family peptidase [Bacteroides sp.]MCM1367118.1 C10 family peptidase [Prevotella sp.]MCM1437351.1 C10 family peptidase [Prevotella sp.]